MEWLRSNNCLWATVLYHPNPKFLLYVSPPPWGPEVSARLVTVVKDRAASCLGPLCHVWLSGVLFTLGVLEIGILFCSFLFFLFLIEKEKARAGVGEEQRGRGQEGEIISSRLHAESRATHRVWSQDPEKLSQSLTWLSLPGAPSVLISYLIKLASFYSML